MWTIQALGTGQAGRHGSRAARGLHALASTCSAWLTIYLKPVLPKLAADVEAFLNIAPLTWNEQMRSCCYQPGHTINPYQHLMTRIDPKPVEAMVDANKQNLEATPAPAPARHAEAQVHAAQPAAGTPMRRHDQHRRLHQDRPAHRPHRQCRTRRRRRQAAAADAGHRRTARATCSPASSRPTRRRR